MNLSVKFLIWQIIIISVTAAIFTCSKSTDILTVEDTDGIRGSIHGSVSDKRGNPMSGVSVTAYPGGETTLSGIDGKFTLPDLRAGKSALVFRCVDYIDTMTDTVTIALKESKKIKTPVKMKFRYGWVSGKVTSDGSKMVDAGVQIENQMAGTRTLPTGSFLLSRVIPGRYKIYGSIKGVGYGVIEHEIEADDTSKCLISITNPGGTIEGTIVDNKNKPVAGATVSAIGDVIADTTDNNGRYTITEVPAQGRFTLTISKGADTVLLAGVQVADSQTISLDPIKMIASKQSDILSILPTAVRTVSGEKTSIFVSAKSNDNSIKIAWYDWDEDGNGTFDRRTPVPLDTGLVFSSGTHKVNVRAVGSDTTVKSETTVIEVTVSEAKDTTAYKFMVLYDTLAGRITPDSGNFLAESRLNLEVTAFNGYIFDRWSGADSALVEENDVFTMPDHNTVLRAVFKLDSNSYGKIIIDTQPKDTSIIDSSKAKLSIVATGDSLRYQWQRNDTDITNATLSSYTTPVMRVAESGTTFRCIVKSGTDSIISKRATVTVYGIVTQPGDTSVVDSSKAVLSIVATGDSLRYQWQRNDTDITNATLSSYTTPVMRVAESGTTFRCKIVVNAAGGTDSLISNRATITVKNRLAIVTHPKDTTVIDSAIAVFSIVATGDSLRYQWQRNDTDIPFETFSSYSTPVGPGQSGTTFRCIVKSGTDSVISDRATVTVTQRQTGTVTDIDGNVYTTIILGNQEWTVENLKTTKYNDGKAIPNVTDSAEWVGLTTGSFCYYNNNPDNNDKYGALYNWHAVNTGNLAPEGWRVPTDDDWMTLANYIITTYGPHIGKSLATQTDWNSSSTYEFSIGNNPGTNNVSGFSAFPAGYRYYGFFGGLGEIATWWSIKVDNTPGAWVLRNYDEGIYGNGPDIEGKNGESWGHSVRLVRDLN